MTITNRGLKTLSIRLVLSRYGDALLYGRQENGDILPGMELKHLLFAWHEPSFFGTELALHQAEGTEFVVLPAEQALSFFGETKRLAHIEWIMEGAAETLAALAPVLCEAAREKRFVPSFQAFREGKLQWTWDEDWLRRQPAASSRSDSRAAFSSEGNEFRLGLEAAFSAAVTALHFSTEAEEADLRREFPALFRRRTVPAGLDAAAWLISIGWRPDVAPFRPALQLQEPFGDQTPWRLRLVLQDKADPSRLKTLRLGADGTPAGSWPAEWEPFVRERANGWLAALREALPGALPEGGSDVFARPLDNDAAWRFLAQESPRLLEAGWLVLLPAWWEAASRKKPRLKAAVSSPEEQRGRGKSHLGLDTLIDFDWRVSIGDAELSEEEFAELVARGERLVRFRGRWIALDPALLAQIGRAMQGMDRSQGLSFQDVLQLHLLGTSEEEGLAEEGEDADDDSGLQIEVELDDMFRKLMRQLQSAAERPAPAVPEELQAQLRGYQQEGFGWLAFLRGLGIGACLADDMGLGKTVQIIAYLLHVREAAAEAAAPFAGGGQLSAALVVCPTSVLGNWQKELERFAPSLRVMLHYGSRRLERGAFLTAAEEYDVVLTSYTTASLDQELLALPVWASIVLDEAQNIKNAETKQAAAVRSFQARHRIALTGTPIENRLSELWSIYSFTMPGYLGSAKAFQARFAGPIEKDRDPKRTADLQKLVKPFMLRRKKKDPSIQLDLPDKTEMKTYLNLTSEQAALYDITVNDLMKRMQELDGIARKGAILSTLTRLKRLCDHPSLVDEDNAPPSGEEEAAAPVSNAVLIERSSKLERLLEMVREVRSEDEKCLIFTQYIGMGQMLQQVLGEELGEPVLYLHGGTPKKARDAMIERFQAKDNVIPAQELNGGAAVNGKAASGGKAGAHKPHKSATDSPSIFILSLKAGGVGLNLTAANHVFHFDRWWNPAVENQATDRAYRMGQTRDVQVHKFIALGTLEERIDEMLESKQQLSDSVISGSEGWITELSDEDLHRLFIRRER